MAILLILCEYIYIYIYIYILYEYIYDFMYSQIKFNIISLRKEMNLILGFEINSGFGDSW